MTNIAKEKLEQISETTGNLVQEINGGISWVEKFLKDEKKIRNAYELKKYRRKLKKIKNAITKKPVIALFGASQVGKSYLVKNILSDHRNRLMISDAGPTAEEGRDFIKEINPEGQGAEATSVVTRFTYEENPGNLPVKIKVLSAKDIIIILCDSYFSDIKKKTRDFRKDDILSYLDEVRDLYTSEKQSFLEEDDVYDIEEYLDKFFSANHKRLLEEFSDANYWLEVASNIHRISPSDWGKVFEILWGKEEKITKLFNDLIKELVRMEFPQKLYSGFEPVLREQGTILDVRRLDEIYTKPEDRVNLVNDSDKNISISRGFLCALSAEVILNISKDSVEQNEFIRETDILDFPGARTRLKLESVEQENLNDMLLRGKVAYLFNSYSLNYEISNLFVCTHSKQSNVRSLPELVNNWIEYNIGENPGERTSTLSQFSRPPLFIIFTWWNMQLEFDQDNDIPKDGQPEDKDIFHYKWKLRFEKLFKEEIMGGFKWDEDWTNSKKFDNYFLLRDFKYSKDVFDGFETAEKETGLRENRDEYYSDLKESFENDPLVNKFFRDPKEVWDETSTPGKDGSEYIIESIQSTITNRIRTQRYINILEDSKNRAMSVLKAHYHSDKADEKIRTAASEGSNIQGYMNKIFGKDAIHFGWFIEKLTIAEKDIYEFFHSKLRDNVLIEKESTNAYILFREASPRLSTEFSYDENVEILRQDYNKNSKEETEAYFQDELDIDLSELFFGELNNLKNRSTVLAEEARDFWYAEKLNPDKFDFFVDLGFRKDLLERLFENMQVNFDKLNLIDEIARHIRVYVDNVKRIDEAENMIAHITAGIINNYVNSVGWNFYSNEEKEKIRITNKENNLNLIFPNDDENFESLEEESLITLFDFMQDLNSNLNKVPLDKETVKNVPMIRHYRRWRELMKISFISNCDIPIYDIEANRLLGQILDNVVLYHFSID